MATEHTVKTYGEELARLRHTIVRMGSQVEAQLAAAIDAIIHRDGDLAASVVEADAKVDGFERDTDALTVRLLALRQPVASDLREIIAALRIAADLERVGDYAANIAKRAMILAQVPPIPPLNALPRMASLVRELLRAVLEAYVTQNTAAAIAVWRRDIEIDSMHEALFRELLTYMMEDPRSITAAAHLLFIAKNVERIGDHATNIAETIHFLVEGTRLREARPKG